MVNTHFTTIMPQAFVATQAAAKQSYHYLDLTTPLQSECTVSGCLSFVLHVSRIAAIAPIKFQKVRGGWRMSLSRFYYAYTILYVIVAHAITSLSPFDTREDFVDGYEASSNTDFMLIVMKLLWIMEILIGLAIAVTGYTRLRHMINSLIYLDHINKEFDDLNLPLFHSEVKTWFKVIYLFIHGYFGSFMEYGIYLNDAINENDKIPYLAINNIMTYIYVLHIQMLSIQVNLVIMHLVFTQQRLNSFLESLLEEIKKDSPLSCLQSCNFKYEINDETTRINIRNRSFSSSIEPATPSATSGSKANPLLLRQLINIYCSLCYILRLLSNGNGVSLTMLLLYCTIYMVTGPYFVVTVMYRTQSGFPLLKMISIMGWCTLCFAMVVTFTEPCHRSHIQLNRTKRLINQIIRYTPKENSALCHELKMFKMQIKLNPVRFSLMHLLKIDRNLSIAVMSLVVTYLSVVINL